MSNISRYLNNAEGRAMRTYNNADGYEFADGYEHANGDAWDYADEYSLANAQASSAKSDPYIITVSNTTTATISNIVVFGGATYLYSQTTNGGVAGATITSNVANVSYLYFLAQTMSKPYNVGELLLYGDTQNQVQQSYLLSYLDASGMAMSKSVTPVTDIYQQVTTGLVYRTPFIVDGFTTLTVPSLTGGGYIKMYFYPMQISSPTRPLTGASGTRALGNPNNQNLNRPVVMIKK